MIYQKQTVSDPQLPFYLFKHHKTFSHPGSCLQNWHENIELLFFRKGEGEVIGISRSARSRNLSI